MERNEELYATILDSAKNAGIKANNLDEAYTSSVLPSEGTFIDWDIRQYKGRPYLVLLSTGKGEVSLSNLCANAHQGTRENAEFSKNDKPENKGKDSYDKFFLTGKSVNPDLAKNQADVAARLIGCNFKATAESFWVLPLEQARDEQGNIIDGKYVFCESEDEARKKLRTKKHYVLSNIVKSTKKLPKYEGTLERLKAK